MLKNRLQILIIAFILSISLAGEANLCSWFGANSRSIAERYGIDIKTVKSLHKATSSRASYLLKEERQRLSTLNLKQKKSVSKWLDTKLMKENEVKPQKVNGESYDIVFVGAGIHNIITLGNALKYRKKGQKLKVLIIDPNTPGYTFDHKDFILNSPNVLESNSILKNFIQPNHLPGLKFQTRDVNTTNKQPHSQDLALALKLNLYWLSLDKTLEIHYLRKSIELDKVYNYSDRKNIPLKLQGEKEHILVNSPKMVIGTGLTKLDFSNNPLAADLKNRSLIHSRKVVEKFIEKPSEEGFYKLVKTSVLSGSDFLYLLAKLPKRFQRKLLNKNIGIVGAAHEGFTVLEAISNLSKDYFDRLHLSGIDLYIGSHKGQVTVFGKGLMMWADLRNAMNPKTPNENFNQAIFSRYRQEDKYHFEVTGKDLAFGDRLSEAYITTEGHKSFFSSRDALGNTHNLDIIVLATQKSRFDSVFPFKTRFKATQLAEQVKESHTYLERAENKEDLSNRALRIGGMINRLNNVIEGVYGTGSFGPQIFINGVAAKYVDNILSTNEGIPNKEAILNRARYSETLGLGLSTASYKDTSSNKTEKVIPKSQDKSRKSRLFESGTSAPGRLLK